MVATNAVKQRTGNVSAGTSSFSMIVLEKDLSKPYEMIDMVTTPDGSLVAMVHCNNCTSDLNAWVNLFKEYQQLLGIPVDMNEVFGKLYNNALTGDADCGGLISYNYISGEPVTGLAEGRPLFVRSAKDKFTLANFMRAHLYGRAVAVLDILGDEFGYCMSQRHSLIFKTFAHAALTAVNSGADSNLRILHGFVHLCC